MNGDIKLFLDGLVNAVNICVLNIMSTQRKIGTKIIIY